MHALLLKFLGMIGFFIKKAFFDGWDNLIGMVLFNLGYIVAIFALFWAVLSAGQASPLFGYLGIALSLIVVAVLMGGSAAVVHNYSDYKRESWAAFRKGIKRNIRHSLLYAVVMILMVLNILFIIPFYSAYGNIFGYFISVIMIWVEIILLLAVPYYFPLMNLLPADRPLKTLKKCFLILGGNMGFSLFFALYRLFCLAVSAFTLGLVPGVCGMQLASQDAMKLLMMKYDYLEENPDADVRHLPWEDILYDEKEKVGPRSLKSMIFPWKY